MSRVNKHGDWWAIPRHSPAFKRQHTRNRGPALSGTITDIRTWSKGADSDVPSPAWNIYVDSQGTLWWHEQNKTLWTELFGQDGWPRFRTTEVPDGARQLVRVIADEVLAELLPADGEDSE